MSAEQDKNPSSDSLHAITAYHYLLKFFLWRNRGQMEITEKHSKKGQEAKVETFLRVYPTDSALLWNDRDLVHKAERTTNDIELYELLAENLPNSIQTTIASFAAELRTWESSLFPQQLPDTHWSVSFAKVAQEIAQDYFFFIATINQVVMAVYSQDFERAETMWQIFCQANEQLKTKGISDLDRYLLIEWFVKRNSFIAERAAQDLGFVRLSQKPE